MADFFQAKNKTLIFEGGYANDLQDRGGETIFGISRRFSEPKYPDFWESFDKIKKSYLPDKKKLEGACWDNASIYNFVAKFYREEFWNLIRGDEIIYQSVANSIFDFAVNSGVWKAVTSVQGILRLSKDGVFGAKTLNAVNNKGEGFNHEICAERARFLRKVAEKPGQAKFLVGWLRRVEAFA